MNVVELLQEIENKIITPEEFLTQIRLASEGQRRIGSRLIEETTIFRTRLFGSNSKPMHFSEISYPPIEKVTLQRANNIGEQVFYGSFGFKTALVESKVSVNEFVVISEWITTDSPTLMHVGILNDDELKKRQIELSELDGLINDIFTRKGDEMYPYSAIIAYHYLRGDNVAGILYPSISSTFESENIALHKEYVDKSLKFVLAYLFQVKAISDHEEYEVAEIAFATSQLDGRLKWENGRTGNLYF